MRWDAHGPTAEERPHCNHRMAKAANNGPFRVALRGALALASGGGHGGGRRAAAWRGSRHRKVAPR